MNFAWLFVAIIFGGQGNQPPGAGRLNTRTGKTGTRCAVRLQEKPEALHFDTDIIPILTKAGCNAGRVMELARGGEVFICRCSDLIRLPTMTRLCISSKVAESNWPGQNRASS